MIDAFRKDFSRLQRGRLTDRRTDGRNSAGIDSALKRFLFFESTRTRGEEVIKNLSRIWRPFFFIGVLHFPMHHYLPPVIPVSNPLPPPLFPPIFPPSFSLSLYLFPFICSRIFLSFFLPSKLFRIRPLWRISQRRPSYLFPTFSLSRKKHDSSQIRREIENVDNNNEIRSRAILLFYLLSWKRIFSDLDEMCIIP